MSIGNGIAIAGIWVGVGLVAIGGVQGPPIAFVAGFAALATLFARP